MHIVDLANRIGLNPQPKNNSQEEWYSACPNKECTSDNDGFVMWPAIVMKKCIGKYWCRRCNNKGDTIDFAVKFSGYRYKDAFDSFGLEGNANVPKLQGNNNSTKPLHKPVILPSVSSQDTELWRSKALSFVNKSHQFLLLNYPLIEKLTTCRGLSLDVIKSSGIGWNPIESYEDNSAWGIISQGKIKLPAGLIIPYRLPSGNIMAIKVRLADVVEGSRYWSIKGSDNSFLITGNRHSKHVFIIESELDAYLMAHINPSICAIAIGGNTKSLAHDIVAETIINKVEGVFIVHDNDAGGLSCLAKHQQDFPKAIAYPTPAEYKDLGEAAQGKMDIALWIKKAINYGNISDVAPIATNALLNIDINA